MVSVTSPRQCSGLLGYLTTRRHINDLAGQDLQNGVEVTAVIRAITESGELVLATDREVRKAGKRARSESENEGAKRSRKESETTHAADLSITDSTSDMSPAISGL